MDTAKALQKKITAITAVRDARKAEVEESEQRIASINGEIELFEECEAKTDQALLKAAGKVSVWKETIAAYKKMRALHEADLRERLPAYKAAVKLHSETLVQLRSYLDGKKDLDTQLKAKKITSDDYKKGKEALKKELGIK